MSLAAWVYEAGSNTITESLLKITLLLVVGWTIHICLARSNPRWRVLLWRVIAVGIVSTPLAVLLLPNWDFALPTEPIPPAGDVAVIAARNSDPATGQIVMTAAPASWLARRGLLAAGLLWGLGVCFLAGRLWLAQRWLGRLLHGASPAPACVETLQRKLAHSLNLNSPVESLCSTEIDSPLACGLARPKIVLPHALCSSEADDTIRAVLAHELAHIKNRDLPWTALLRLTSILLWFHPLAWLMVRRHGSACERIGDAVAARLIGDVDSYSRSLAAIALNGANRAMPVSAIPMAGRSRIRARLESLRRRGDWNPLSRLRMIAGITCGVATVIALGCVHVAPARNERGDIAPLDRRWRLGEAHTFRDLRIELSWIDHGDPADPTDDEATIKITSARQEESEATIRVNDTIFFGDYELNLREIGAPPPTQPHPEKSPLDNVGDWARIRLRWLGEAKHSVAPLPPEDPNAEWVIQIMRVGDELTYKDLRIRLIEIEVAEPNERGDDEAEFEISTSEQKSRLTMRLHDTVFFEDYELYFAEMGELALHVAPSADSSGGHRNYFVRVAVRSAETPLAELAVDNNQSSAVDASKPIRGEPREIRNFWLFHRDADRLDTESLQLYASRLVEAIQTMLYASTGATVAAQSGRQLWFDVDILQLTIVDSTENLQRVRTYLDAQPDLDATGATEENMERVKRLLEDARGDRDVESDVNETHDESSPPESTAERPNPQITRSLDLSDVSPDMAYEVLERYGFARERRRTLGGRQGASESFLERGTVALSRIGERGGTYEVLAISPKAAEKMDALLKDELRERESTAAGKRLVSVTYGIVPAPGGYDLGVKDMEFGTQVEP